MEMLLARSVSCGVGVILQISPLSSSLPSFVCLSAKRDWLWVSKRVETVRKSGSLHVLPSYYLFLQSIREIRTFFVCPFPRWWNLLLRHLSFSHTSSFRSIGVFVIQNNSRRNLKSAFLRLCPHYNTCCKRNFISNHECRSKNYWYHLAKERVALHFLGVLSAAFRRRSQSTWYHDVSSWPLLLLLQTF